MAGPKSDPPIPIFTTSVNDLPEYPLHSPEITESVNSLIRRFTSYTSSTTFTPFTITVSEYLARNAVCNTARPSV